MTDLPAPPSPWTKFYRLVNHHGFVSSSIVAIVLSFFFWWLAWDERELSYSVRSNRSILFDSENPLGFKLVFEDSRTPEERTEHFQKIIGATIENEQPKVETSTNWLAAGEVARNVYSAQLLIWNSGTLPIKPEHILKPIKLRIGFKPEEGDTLLDLRVTKAARLDINKISFSVTVPAPEPEAEGPPATFGEISWEILEPEDYAIVQIVYSGEDDAEIKLDGVIEGKVPIHEVSDLNQTSYLNKGFAVVGVLNVGILLATLFPLLMDIRFPGHRTPLWYKRFTWTLALLTTCAGLVVLGSFIWMRMLYMPPVNF